MGKISLTFVTVIALVMGVNGQAVKTAAKAGSAPAPTAQNKSAKAEPVKAEPVAASRFVDEESMKSYIDRLSKDLSMSHRVLDPFGLNQDPNAQPVIHSRIEARNKPQEEVKIPVNEVVKRLNVTMVKPKSKQFVIDGRTLGVGSTLPILYKGKRLNLVIQDISAAKIVFMNESNGDTGEYLMEQLPKGFTKGTQSVKMPGTKEAKPIEIDSQE